MQTLSLLAAIIVGVGIGIINAMIGMETGYDATSLLFYFILPLGAALLGFVPGFVSGMLDASHKGQSEVLPVVWGVLGGVSAVVTYYGFFFVQSGAYEAGVGIDEFLSRIFENYDLGPITGILELAAAGIGGFIGAGIGANSARSMGGSERIPPCFGNLANVLVAMIGVDGSVDEQEKTLGRFGLELALGQWFGELNLKTEGIVKNYAREVIDERVENLDAVARDLDTDLAAIKARGEKMINIACIGVFSVAAADDVIDPAEEKLLREMLSKLGLPETEYKARLEVGKKLAEAFKPEEG